MLKIISDNAWAGDLWNEDNPRCALIKRSSRGVVDRGSFIKRAAASSDELLSKIDGMDVKPGEELIHLIALGATEAYGPNRNGDGFSKEASRKYHDTFVKHAHFYRDHKNTDPKKSYGIVKASAFNEAMSRIELIVALNANEKAAKANNGLVADREMEKLASGKDIALSMACFTDPEYPILTRERGYIPIGEIVPGLHVWTKDSGWKAVTGINRRKYSGKVYTISVCGLPFPIEVTADHPLWVKHFESAGVRPFNNPDEFDDAEVSWMTADRIAVGDRLFHKPISTWSSYASIEDEDLATILGYYVAEGYVKSCDGNPNCVPLICNLSDSLPRRVPAIMANIYPDVKVAICPHRNSKQGLVVTIYSASLARYINDVAGTGCRSKVVPFELFNSSDKVKLSFLGAWIDGDGCVDGKGCHISTASRNLALQCRDLFATLGIPASIYRIDHSKCETSGRENSGIEYTVNVSCVDLARLSDYSEKVRGRDTSSQRTKPGRIRKCADGTFAYRVKEITFREVNGVVTYNFEVEDDHSYTAAGIISHNCGVPFDVCSYCGNKAVTQSQYCTGTHEGGMCKAGGLKHNMGRLMSVDGKLVQLYADNTKPDFFDISHVFVPADRIAYASGSLRKAASYNGEVLCGAELARRACLTAPAYLGMEKSASLAAQALLRDAVDAFHSRKLWEKRASFMGVMTSRELRDTHVPRRYKFAELQSALVEQGVCLTPSQFVKLITGNQKEAMALGEVIGPISNDILQNEQLDLMGYVKEGCANSVLRNWVREQRLPSVFPEHFLKQASLAAFEEAPDFTMTKEAVYEMANDPDVRELATQYAMYKLGFVSGLPSALQQVASELLVGRDYLSF